jgi:hypothetical protein
MKISCTIMRFELWQTHRLGLFDCLGQAFFSFAFGRRHKLVLSGEGGLVCG